MKQQVPAPSSLPLMTPQQLLDLAKQIYVIRVALSKEWDHQTQARECLNAAMHFYLAVERASVSAESEATTEMASPLVPAPEPAAKAPPSTPAAP